MWGKYYSCMQFVDNVYMFGFCGVYKTILLTTQELKRIIYYNKLFMAFFLNKSWTGYVIGHK